MSNKNKTSLTLFVYSALFLQALVGGVIIPLLPQISRLTGASAQGISVLYALYPLTMILFSIPFGILMDRIGTKHVLIGGLVALCLSTVFFIFSESYQMFLLSRLIQSVAAAAIWTAGLATIFDLFSPAVRGEKVGVAMAAEGLGYIAGPALGGFLGAGGNLSWPFLACAALIAVNTVTLTLLIPATSEKNKTDHPPKPTAAVPASLSSLVTIWLFTTIGFAGLGIIESLLPLFLSQKFNTGSILIGAFFTLLSLAIALSQPYFGKMSDRMGRKIFILAGLALFYSFLLMIPALNGLIELFVIGTMMGVAFGCFTAPSGPLIMETFESRYQGTRALGVGIINTSFTLGVGLGALVGGFFYERFGFQNTVNGYAAITFLFILGILLFPGNNLFYTLHKEKSPCK